MSKRILFLHSDKGACAKYRCWIPTVALNEAGVFARYSDTWVPKMLEEFEIFVFQRISHPQSLDLLVSLREKGKLVVYDIDDDVISIPLENPVFWVHLRRPDIPWTILMCARFADYVTVSTPGLKELMEQLNPNVLVMPNFLNLKEHENIEPIRVHSNRLLLFWGGSNTHKRALQLLEPVLPEVLKANKDIHVVIMGDELPFDLPVERRTYVPWGQYEFFQRILKGCDIGLAPLDDSLFNQRKSDLRIKELAVGGLPIVASPVREYKKSALEAGQLLASRPHKWVECILRLAEDNEFRLAQAAKAKAWAQRQGIRENNPWLKLLELERQPFHIAKEFLKQISSKEPSVI